MTASSKKTPLCGSSRLALAIVGFLGSVNLYALRIDMSVAVVCMVNHTALRDAEASKIGNETKPIPRCGVVQTNNSQEDGPFLWNKEDQGSVLGIFFWGYLASQIPASILVGRIGARWTIAIFMSMSTIATLLLPVLTLSVGSTATKVLRFIMGLGSGVWFPAFHTLWSIWAPPAERSLLAGITYAGSQIGNVITLPLAALLCKYGFGGGWPSVFYVFGCASVVWVVAWLVFAFDSPAKHPRISSAERDYIESALASTPATDSEQPENETEKETALCDNLAQNGNGEQKLNAPTNNCDNEHAEANEYAANCDPTRTPVTKKQNGIGSAEDEEEPNETNVLVVDTRGDEPARIGTLTRDGKVKLREDQTDIVTTRCCGKPLEVHTRTTIKLGSKRFVFDFPLVAILCSMPVWSTWVANVTFDFGLYLFLTTIPTFMKEVLGFEITQNGFISALPFVLFWAVITGSGYITDVLIERKLLSVTGARKLMTSVGMLVPAALIVLLSFVDCERTALAVTILTIGVAVSGTGFSGFVVNHMDIAPRYAGILFAIGNSAAAATGYFAPYIVSVLTKGATGDELAYAWRSVFFICASVYTCGAIFYLLFASGELQPWCVPKNKQDEEQKSKTEEVA